MQTIVQCCAPLVDEPLQPDEASRLAEWFGVLADPTRLRLLSLISVTGEACAACDLVEPLGVRSQAAPEEHRWGWSLDTIFGLQTHPGEYHKTGFSAARIEGLMAEAGFAQVRVSWIWSHGQRCLWIEAARPQAQDTAHLAGLLFVEHDLVIANTTSRDKESMHGSR